MNTTQKHEIKELVEREYSRLGSMRNVAKKCDVSEATISQVINENWELISDKMWTKIAKAVDWKLSSWSMVNTTNHRVLQQVFEDAKEHQMFIGVAHGAGSGKTQSAKSYAAMNASQGVYYIQAQEWARRRFLVQICQTLGIVTDGTTLTGDELIQQLAQFFIDRSPSKPLLIIDEADKLKADALRVIIPIYNILEDKMGMVLMGTDNLERQIKIGVQYNKKGFDEIYSRIGRKFVNLIGVTKKDVQSICQANGIDEKEIQDKIWEEGSPMQVMVDERSVRVVRDLRRIKRAVKRELAIKSA